MWRGDRRRPSPQPFRTLLIAVLLAFAPGVAEAGEPASASVEDAVRGVARDLADADALKEAGACEEAVPLYEAVIARMSEAAAAPHRAVVRYEVAICYEQLGQPESARAQFDAIVESRPPRMVLRDALYRRALLDVVPGTPTVSARRDLRRVRRLAKDPLDKKLVDLQLARLDSLEGRSNRALMRLLRAGKALDEAGDDADRDRRGAPLDWYRAETAVVAATLWAAGASKVDLSLYPTNTVIERVEERGVAMGMMESHTAVAAGFPQPWAPRALDALGEAWLETSEALAGLLSEARGHLVDHPDDEAVRALILWLEPRIAPQFRKAAEAWRLCVESSRVLHMAVDVGEHCQERLDALVRRPELQPASLTETPPSGGSRAPTPR